MLSEQPYRLRRCGSLQTNLRATLVLLSSQVAGQFHNVYCVPLRAVNAGLYPAEMRCRTLGSPRA